MIMPQKRVAAIHDISGFGKCSLTVALPIISAAKIETAVIPTAVLSTHTGGFKGYTFRDLTEDILPIAKHWKSENLKFDGIYTGYLGSKKQVGLVKQTINLLKDENTLVVVDPVMGDHGKLYAGFSSDFPKEMLTLCKEAHIIVPNFTEAAFMLGEKYIEPPYTKEYVENLIKRLATATGAQVVLTGVCFKKNEIGASVYKNGEIFHYITNREDAVFHGTGDVFASALTAALLSNKTVFEAAKIAVDFTVLCIKKTLEENSDRRYGVNFESCLFDLIKALE